MPENENTVTEMRGSAVDSARPMDESVSFKMSHRSKRLLQTAKFNRKRKKKEMNTLPHETGNSSTY